MKTNDQPGLVIRPIQHEQDYTAALLEIESLIEAQPGTSQMIQLERVSELVHAYEQREFPIENPDPIDLIEYQREQLEIEHSMLAEWVGGEANLLKLLNHKQPLSFKQAKILSVKLEIPIEILLNKVTQ